MPSYRVDNTYREIEVIVTDITEIIEVREEKEDKKTAELCELNSAVSQAELRHAVKEELQIELHEVTVSEIKLSPDSSLNDHTGSYITVLTERRGSITTVMRRAEKELNTDKSISRRDDISLQGMMTITTATREVEEGEEDNVTMRAVLLQFINIIIFIFN
ncbi:hypothetical protein BDBG_00163 [Blastomyces gilchristii SLH14081]|uniref:Uncharacterized protein n=1 Tax=Blastomyces gilchristii (strain SLH14081) TaxID=559298 RepID=A0A179U623_BLAGS|nr:uncharacterized protein BDBG_00163 [Blastomyces gilchristii SLH14081]OAT03446.1 hypothetical protein BDBG_00163 [Blastomyces gilchristii SLH14081]